MIWDVLSPNGKKEMKLNLSNSSEPGVNTAFRKKLGINLSNEVCVKSSQKTSMEEKIEEFLNNDYVSRVTPDVRKTSKGTAIRYVLGNYKTLHQKFISIVENCSYQTFLRAIPHYVRKHSASEWGTCLCALCLNPELKLESLVNKKMLEKVNLEDTINSESDFKYLLATLKSITEKFKNESVLYNAWIKVPTPLSRKGCTISRKMLFSEKVPELCKLLINELNILKEHLLPALMQFKAFKSAREKAMSRSALTIHIDWSENAKLRQSREEKSAYYNETQVSIHCGYVRYGKDGYSLICLHIRLY